METVHGKTPLSVHYDEFYDMVTINGKRYAGDVFRHLGIVTEPGMWFRTLTSPYADYVMIHTALESAIKEGKVTAGKAVWES